MRRDYRSKTRNSKFEILKCLRAFALYEVLHGVAIFAVGDLALGRAVENCLNAIMLDDEEEAVRQMLSNRMAEVQAARGVRDRDKEFKIDSVYGPGDRRQKSAPD